VTYRTFVSNIFLIFLFLFFSSSLSCSNNDKNWGRYTGVDAHDSTYAFLQVEEEADRRIVQLNDDLIHTHLVAVSNILGDLPADANPRSFLVKRGYWNFYEEGVKVLRLVELLVRYKNIASCQACLNAINEVFYLQFYEFLGELSIDEKKDAYGNLKTRLLETLFHVYQCQNHGKLEMTYSYETPPLALTFTKLVVTVFRVVAIKQWVYEKKKSFLMQRLDGCKASIFSTLHAMSSSEGKYVPTYEELSLFIDTLKHVTLKKPTPFPWATVLKWVGAGTLVVVFVVGGYWAFKHFGASAADNLGKKPIQVGKEEKSFLKSVQDFIESMTDKNSKNKKKKENAYARFLRAWTRILTDKKEGAFTKLAGEIARMLGDDEPGGWTRFCNRVADMLRDTGGILARVDTNVNFSLVAQGMIRRGLTLFGRATDPAHGIRVGLSNDNLREVRRLNNTLESGSAAVVGSMNRFTQEIGAFRENPRIDFNIRGSDRVEEAIANLPGAIWRFADRISHAWENKGFLSGSPPYRERPIPNMRAQDRTQPPPPPPGYNGHNFFVPPRQNNAPPPPPPPRNE